MRISALRLLTLSGLAHADAVCRPLGAWGDPRGWLRRVAKSPEISSCVIALARGRA
jgi:hypothetical protein